MSNGGIDEKLYLSWTDEQKAIYNFRVINEIRADVKKLTAIRLACNSAAAFVGGIVGGLAAMLGASRWKIFG